MHAIRLSALAALSVALAAAGCDKQESAKTAETSRSLAVRVLPAAARTFERRLAVQGTLETKYSAQVAARADGNLDAIWVNEGDEVVAGQTALFQVDPSTPPLDGPGEQKSFGSRQRSLKPHVYLRIQRAGRAATRGPQIGS